MRLLMLLGVVVLTAEVAAHHGSAEYHVDREVTVSGVIQEWRWTNPHTWVYLRAAGAPDRQATWSGEGPPLSWAQQRGWSKDTLRAGEEVTLVMYPSRQDARAGLVKRIRRANGELLVVSRPWLNERN
jgi:hypothetical protein